jgi:hypothetical protein
MLRSMKRAALVSAMAVLVALMAAGAAMATKGQDFVTCDNGHSYPITVTQQPNDNSVGWGVGRIGGGDHLIPTGSSGSFYDETIGQTLDSFSQAKGKRNGQRNRAQLTCQTPTETFTLEEFLGGEPMPPEWEQMGAQLTDQVSFTLTVTAVQRP